MRIVWLLFAGLLVAMALLLPRRNRLATRPVTATIRSGSQPLPALPVGNSPQRPAAAGSMNMPLTRADSLVAFGLAQQGAPYVYAGTSPLTGFDCSGFIFYTFARFHVAVPHSTALLISVGLAVPRADAQPGDIVVFTGTALTSTTPGHAGIVVSGRGQLPLRFVHASSARRESGVKVSQVEGSDYERRFLQVRRVPGLDKAPADRGKPVVAARESVPVTTLHAHSVALVPKINPTFYPPKILTYKSLPLSISLKNKKSKGATKELARPVINKLPGTKTRRKQPAKSSRAIPRPGH